MTTNQNRFEWSAPSSQNGFENRPEPVCHMCRWSRKPWQLSRVRDGRLFCKTDIVGCYYLARIALGVPRWQAAKEKRADAERLRQGRRAA